MEEIISHGYNGYLFDADSLSSLKFYLDLVLKDDQDYNSFARMLSLLLIINLIQKNTNLN